MIDSDTFTNESAMMLAHERALESARDDALFNDPLAATLAGPKGEELSRSFGISASGPLGFEGWHGFHVAWTAVRTHFIDSAITAWQGAQKVPQIVNLGAGMDTRAFRLPCYKDFELCLDVDMAVINEEKAKVFAAHVDAAPLCVRRDVPADFNEGGLRGVLDAAGYDGGRAAVFLAEGLVMYLKDKEAFLREVSQLAHAGSLLVLNYMGDEDTTSAFAHSVADMRALLVGAGWTDCSFHHFGDDTLNFGRYNKDFAPSHRFSFVTCTKA